MIESTPRSNFQPEVHPPVFESRCRGGNRAIRSGDQLHRVQVTLATGIPREICAEINLGYRDPATIDPEDLANREDEGVLLVPKAGEMLYHLRKRPDWAGEM